MGEGVRKVKNAPLKRKDELRVERGHVDCEITCDSQHLDVFNHLPRFCRELISVPKPARV